MVKNLLTILCCIGFVVAFGYAVNIGLQREARRMDAAKVYNCTHYGAKINKDAGREICPPTPQG